MLNLKWLSQKQVANAINLLPNFKTYTFWPALSSFLSLTWLNTVIFSCRVAIGSKFRVCLPPHANFGCVSSSTRKFRVRVFLHTQISGVCLPPHANFGCVSSAACKFRVRVFLRTQISGACLPPHANFECASSSTRKFRVRVFRRTQILGVFLSPHANFGYESSSTRKLRVRVFLHTHDVFALVILMIFIFLQTHNCCLKFFSIRGHARHILIHLGNFIHVAFMWLISFSLRRLNSHPHSSDDQTIIKHQKKEENYLGTDVLIYKKNK